MFLNEGNKDNNIKKTNFELKSNKLRTKLLLMTNNDNYKTMMQTFTKINSKTLKEFQMEFKNEIFLGKQFFRGNKGYSQHKEEINLIKAQDQFSSSKKMPFSPNSRKKNLSSKKMNYFNLSLIKLSFNNSKVKIYKKYDIYNNNKDQIISEFNIEDNSNKLNNNLANNLSTNSLSEKFQKATESYSYLQYLCQLSKGENLMKKSLNVFNNRITDKNNNFGIERKLSKSQDKKSKLKNLKNEKKSVSLEKNKINYSNLEQIIKNEIKKKEKLKNLKIEIENHSDILTPVETPIITPIETPKSAIKIELNFKNPSSNNISLYSRHNSIEIDDSSFNNSICNNFNSYSKRSSFMQETKNNTLNNLIQLQQPLSVKNFDFNSKLASFDSLRRNSNNDYNTSSTMFKINLKNCRKYTEKEFNYFNSNNNNNLNDNKSLYSDNSSL